MTELEEIINTMTAIDADKKTGDAVLTWLNTIAQLLLDTQQKRFKGASMRRSYKHDRLTVEIILDKSR